MQIGNSKMERQVSTIAILLLVQVLLGCWGQVMLDEDIDDTSDMDGGYADDHKYNGQDWDNGRRNGLYPDDRGRSEFFHKSPYDDDDLDHRGHEHSEAYRGSCGCLSSQNLLFLVTALASYQLLQR